MSEETNETQLKKTPSTDELNDKELRAIELRYLGKTSREIADATGYNEVYVRNLFMQGGRLEKAFEEFASRQRAQNEERVKSALNRAKEEAKDAVERIIALS